MPSIQDLNAFKNAVNQLGNEPEIAQSRDEVLEDIQPGEEGLPLMPELSAAREALEQEQLAKTAEQEAEATLVEPEPEQGEDTDLDNIVMSDNEAEVPDEAAEPETAEDDFGFLSGLEQDADAFRQQPEADISELENVDDTASLEELEAEIEAEGEVPQSVFQMLDTGFGELDSERLSSDLLDEDEDEINIFDEPEDRQEEQTLEDVLDEEPEIPVETFAAEPVEAEAKTDDEDLLTDTDAAEVDTEDTELPPEFDEVIAQQDEEPLDENKVEELKELEAEQGMDFAAGEELVSETEEDKSNNDDLPPPPPGSSKSVMDSVAALEKALHEHRSIDMLSISEEEFDDDENKIEELEFYISDENARDFLLQLSSYPIALKLAIEEEIGENNLNEETVETLVEMVSFGANPRHVANYFFSQTGKRILLPKGKRYHAIDRDDINLRFYRQFAQIGLPLIRHAILGMVLLAILFWLPFYYIYRPIQAYLYYQKGYNEILLDRFNNAEHYFTLATNGWPLFNDSVFVKGWPYKTWFLDYALGYASRKDFGEATFKFRETLRYYPDYKNAWFQYMVLLSKEMGEYAQAERIIQQYYNRFGRDYDSLIIRGLNYLYWGNTDPSYYEEARQIFGATYALESKDDLPLLYLLDYSIRTAPYKNNETQLQKLTSFFMESDPETLEVPANLYAQILSKTADYYLNRGKVDVAKKLLLNATQVSSNSMEVYRSFARYYDIIGDPDKELEALNMSLFFLNFRDDHNTTSNLMEKLSLTQQRARFAASQNEMLDTSFIFSDLLVQLREVHRRRLDIDQTKSADIYAMFGNFYYQNIPESLISIAYYQKATSLGLSNPTINYRYGYQLYQQKDFNHAVEQFLQSQLTLNDNNKVKYALGNSLLQIGSYNSAQGVLEEVYTSLQEELRQSFLLDPQYSREARDRLFMLVRLANDIGVSYYEETLQSPNISNEEIALAYLIQAMGYLDILSRKDTVMLKLPPELLFRPRLLTKKTIDLLENSIPAQGLVPGSLPDQNFKEILESKANVPSSDRQIQPYWMDILNPNGLEETMNY